MSWQRFWMFYLCLMCGMLVFRYVPMFVLKQRTLSERTTRILSLIPASAFAALVANDLLSNEMLGAGFPSAFVPLAATVVVAAVAYKSKSLLASAVVGVVSYTLFMLII